MVTTKIIIIFFHPPLPPTGELSEEDQWKMFMAALNIVSKLPKLAQVLQ